MEPENNKPAPPEGSAAADAKIKADADIKVKAEADVKAKTDADAKAKTAADDKSKNEFIPLQMPDGTIENVKPEEAYKLAIYGYGKLKEEHSKEKSSTKIDKIEEDTDAKVLRLEKELGEFKQEKERDKALNDINRTLYESAQQHESTKINTKLAAKINALALARVNMNPRLDLKTVYKEELADYLELVRVNIKESETSNGKIKAAMSGSIRSGGMPALDADKKFKAEDIKSGASRRALEEWLTKANA